MMEILFTIMFTLIIATVGYAIGYATKEKSAERDTRERNLEVEIFERKEAYYKLLNRVEKLEKINK